MSAAVMITRENPTAALPAPRQADPSSAWLGERRGGHREDCQRAAETFNDAVQRMTPLELDELNGRADARRASDTIAEKQL